jgi:hypothetical protein
MENKANIDESLVGLTGGLLVSDDVNEESIVFCYYWKERKK